MNEAVMHLLNDENLKSVYYAKAQEAIKTAGLANIQVDRTQFTARPSGDKIIIRIAVKKFTKRTVSTAQLRQLKHIPMYRSVYDRFKRMKGFEHRPLFEWGYMEFEYQPYNNY